MAPELLSGIGLGGNVQLLLLDARASERARSFYREDSPMPFVPPTSGIVREIRVKNRIVKTGRQAVRELLLYPQLGGSGFTPGYIGVGSGGATAVTDLQTALAAEVAILNGKRKAITRRYAEEVSGDPAMSFQLFIDTTEANGPGTQPLSEAGIFTPDLGGTMWARTTFVSFNKSSSISVIINWRIPLSAV